MKALLYFIWDKLFTILAFIWWLYIDFSNFITSGLFLFFVVLCFARAIDASRRNARLLKFVSNIEYRKACFYLYGYVARGSGVITKEHIAVMQSLINSLNLNPTDNESLKQSFNEGKNSSNPKEACDVLYQTTKLNESFAIEFFVVCINLALLDNEIEQEEYDRLHVIANFIKFSNNTLDRMIREKIVLNNFKRARSGNYSNNNNYQDNSYQYQQNNSYSGYARNDSEYEAALKVFGVDKNTSFEDIRKAYKKLAARYHPDKVQNRPDLKQQYLEKFQEIQNAYDIIKANHPDAKK